MYSSFFSYGYLSFEINHQVILNIFTIFYFVLERRRSRSRDRDSEKKLDKFGRDGKLLCTNFWLARRRGAIFFIFIFFLFPCEISYFALSNFSQDFVRECFFITLLFICKDFKVIFFCWCRGARPMISCFLRSSKEITLAF